MSACGGKEECTTIGCDDAAPGNGASAGTGGTGSGGTSNTGTGFLNPDDDLPGAGGNTLEEGEACREVVFAAQTNPVNVLILLDRSTSMLELADAAVPGVTRWDAVTAALKAFVNSPQAENARIGLQFFGLTNGADDCGVDKYAVPAVPVAPLATNRAALLQAIDTTLPGSLTPTAPAVSGALRYALQVAQDPANVDVPTVMVLASDGLPSECGPMGPDGQQIVSFREIIDTLESYSAPPTDAMGTPMQPPVRTFIVGTSELRSNAQSLAEAGNGQAFLVGGGTPGADLQARFLDALLSIIVRPLDCEIDVPQTAPDTGETVDFEKVRLRFTGASSGSTTEFPRTTGPQTCGVSQAWFYENANPPTKIFLCRNACDSLGAGELKLELGCSPQMIVR
ncbi:MAG TPA: vWA domain-containing protein [Polyangiaceae bacterium]|nr:vWA domain-containing protein [Polyangiaceae bacterium]